MLPKEKLPEVVAEVDRLWQQKKDTLDHEEARVVLAEVGLPAELLEEALEEIRKREEARRKRTRNIAVGAAVVLAAVLLVGGATLARSRTSSAYANVTATSTELADERSPGKEVSVTRREAKLRLDAELARAPMGEEVPLSCDWVAPSGVVAHHNGWKTKPVDHDPWRTHCTYTVPTSAETGRWRVRMSLNGREIAVREVTVE